jgi:hypothetical protein
MLLINRTPLHAAIVPNADDHDGIVALFIVAATFDIGPDRLRFSEEQRPLMLAPFPPEIGDGYLTKAGTSVCASGFVYAPNGEALRADALLGVGDKTLAVRAFGKRVWQSGGGGVLVPTVPLPFDRVAMTWENAFGGAVIQPTRLQKMASGQEAIVPEHPEAYSENSDGTGFYPAREDAIDQPLPQLEDPEHPIEKWSDRPDPVCFAPYPMHGGLRARFVVENDVVDFKRHPYVLSRAAPRATFGELAFGTRIAVSGMRAAAEVLAFDIPEPPVTADVIVGKRHRRLTLYVDAIDIDAEAANVRIVYRALFSYPLVRYEERTTRVLPAPVMGDLMTPAASGKAPDTTPDRTSARDRTR